MKIRNNAKNKAAVLARESAALSGVIDYFEPYLFRNSPDVPFVHAFRRHRGMLRQALGPWAFQADGDNNFIDD